jgi:uncharacterized protein (DUF952 family)
MDRLLLLLYGALTACFCIVQAICIIKTGRVSGVFAQFADKSTSAPKPSITMRVQCALVYFVGGIGLIGVLFVSAAKLGPQLGLDAWHLVDIFPHLVGPLFLQIAGVWGMVRPRGLLGWARRAHPEISENDPFLLGMVRVIGAGMFAIDTVLIFAFGSKL